MNRSLSGLVIGQGYQVTVQTWTDDVDQETGLLAEFLDGTSVVASRHIVMAAGSGVQTLTQELCAKKDTLVLRLSEAGPPGVGSSPIVTNIDVAATGVDCNFTVTFNSVGGTGVATQTVVQDDSAAEPAPPTRPGSGFAGWYTDAAYTTLYDFSTPVTADITLYARWTPNAYYVSGSVQGLAAGNALTLNNSNGDTVQVAADGRFQFAQSLLGSGSYAVTIAAQPARQVCTVTQAPSGGMNNADVSNVLVQCVGPYTVTYDALGGSAVAPETVAPAVAATRPADPVLAGAVFGGWFTDSGFANAYNFATPVNADITLYAKWTGAYTVSGTVVGLAAGQTVVLQNQVGETVTQAADGPFGFLTQVVDQGAYAVVVSAQPSGQQCVVTQGAGIIAAAPVTNVLVTCTAIVVAAAATPVPATSFWVLVLMAVGLGGVAIRRLRQV